VIATRTPEQEVDVFRTILFVLQLLNVSEEFANRAPTKCEIDPFEVVKYDRLTALMQFAIVEFPINGDIVPNTSENGYVVAALVLFIQIFPLKTRF